MGAKSFLALKGQSGAALVIALVIMIVLTLIGLASTLTSNFENKLSGHKRGSTDAFYTAESGIQAALAEISNFIPSTYAPVPDLTKLPEDLRSEPIDSELTSPSVDLSPGETFNNPPTVTIYHTTKAGAPRGSHLSAAGSYEFEYFIIDSTGYDQLELTALTFQSQIKEQVVRMIPTTQGGN